MQLATKISELAGIKQEEEIQKEENQKTWEHSRAREHNEDGESQDMFLATQDGSLPNEFEERTPTNPFLAAKLRKENSYSANSRLESSNSFISPDVVDYRNPFKKSSLTPQR